VLSGEVFLRFFIIRCGEARRFARDLDCEGVLAGEPGCEGVLAGEASCFVGEFSGVEASQFAVDCMLIT
jgi:hypothetical protein